jgi:CRP-like cAMP-binding protein
MPSPKIDPREFLKRLPLFADLSPEELSLVAAGTTEHHIPRGSAVFQRGDPCVGFHMVIFGQVKLSFLSSQGNEKIVEIIGPGHSFGEALMFMEKPYIVTAHAVSDCMLLHISKHTVFAELARNPQFARRMLAGMSRRLHGLIIGYLLKDDDAKDGSEITLAVSKKLLASRLNLTPEYFSRVLHELADQGMIAVNGRQIRILDSARLRAYEG